MRRIDAPPIAALVAGVCSRRKIAIVIQNPCKTMGAVNFLVYYKSSVPAWMGLARPDPTLIPAPYFNLRPKPFGNTLCRARIYRQDGEIDLLFGHASLISSRSRSATLRAAFSSLMMRCAAARQIGRAHV